jgi:hypothetical protein
VSAVVFLDALVYVFACAFSVVLAVVSAAVVAAVMIGKGVVITVAGVAVVLVVVSVAGEIFGSSHELVMSRLSRASRSEERHRMKLLCCVLAAQTDQKRSSGCSFCVYFCG